MSSAEIEISNFALSLLGQQAIRSFDEDNSRARLCKNIYDLAVGVVLARLDWSFARWKAELRIGLNTGLPLDEGYSAYKIPADCVTPIALEPYGRRISWEVVGIYLITATRESLRLKYTRRELNSALFPNTFKGSVARLMAACLAGPLTGASITEVNALNNLYEFELTIATASDANIGSESPDPDENPNNDTFNLGAAANLLEDFNR